MDMRNAAALAGLIFASACLVSPGKPVEGPAGPAGPKGDTGPTGPQGPAGSSAVTLTALAAGDVNCGEGGTALTTSGGTTYACNGATGPAGAQGPAGPQGDAGAPGPQGPTGPTGPMPMAALDAGLLGTGTTMDPLAVAFAGGGVATTVARSDHAHTVYKVDPQPAMPGSCNDFTVTAACNGGDTLVGGACAPINAPCCGGYAFGDSFTTKGNYPSGNAWVCRYINSGGAGCATVATAGPVAFCLQNSP